MNKYLEKIAKEWMSQDTKSDLVNTGTLGAVGGLETVGMAKVLNHSRLKNMHWLGKGAIGGAVTLGVDYAGLQMAKGINKARGAKVNPNDHL